MEVNRLGRETGHYVLDGVISVIDVENWKGYDDTSYTAKKQAEYTDLIVLNKWELVSERKLDECIDRILDIELDVPTAREKSDKGWVDKDLIFGLDAKLASLNPELQNGSHDRKDEHSHDHQSEVEVLSVTLSQPAGGMSGVDLAKLEGLLSKAPKDEVYRIKAVLYASTTPVSSTGERAQAPQNQCTPSRYILNWAFGRWTFNLASPGSSSTASASSSRTDTPVDSDVSTPVESSGEPTLRMTIITARYESTKWRKRIEAGEFIALEGNANDAELHVSRAL